MNWSINQPAGLARPVAAARILAQFDRTSLEAFIAVAIGVLDAVDGDPDEEADGDELDGTASEDDFLPHGNGFLEGPGCPLSDPPEIDDEDCDGFENEPLFDRGQCARLNRFYGDGPGGGILVDPDHGDQGE